MLRRLFRRHTCPYVVYLRWTKPGVGYQPLVAFRSQQDADRWADELAADTPYPCHVVVVRHQYLHWGHGTFVSFFWGDGRGYSSLKRSLA